ncbi:GNAT family N-acetyltransferase [Halorubrum lipolyticum]|uniref:GCN5-related N-acetyltransferase n=1 Tax=Halorubrum lipolyticum DSM 21995 TaxID=1227482 RepID=M0P391_9EURY|nr:GNAT family N-acetyltransferase [Halorubrum lipolyticum]EMA64627.1 GCN5-related N-acetyltransferase [Halorubrum lipolyticum DSM 21995]
MADSDRVRVTPATVDDVDPVTDLWVALAEGQRAYGSALLAEGNRAAVREWVARSVVTGELLVARDGDDDPIGFVGFTLDRGGYERDRTRGVVSNLFVVPERRDEGIGADLLDGAERALRETGAETVALEALAANDRAREFYAAQGYEPHRVELTKSLAAAGGEGGDDRGGEDGDDDRRG